MDNQDLTPAIPVRFFESDKAIVEEMARSSRLPVATIIRIAAHYALPKFASGEVNIFDLVTTPQPVATTEGKQSLCP